MFRNFNVQLGNQILKTISAEVLIGQIISIDNKKHKFPIDDELYLVDIHGNEYVKIYKGVETYSQTMLFKLHES